MVTKNTMLDNIKDLGLIEAVVDTNASIDGTRAILLRKDGKEEYYTGKDIYEPGDDPFDPSRTEYQNWLVENFK